LTGGVTTVVLLEVQHSTSCSNRPAGSVPAMYQVMFRLRNDLLCVEWDVHP